MIRMTKINLFRAVKYMLDIMNMIRQNIKDNTECVSTMYNIIALFDIISMFLLFTASDISQY